MILTVDGQDVDDPDAFGYRYALKGIGGQTSLTVMRGGKRIVMPVKLQTPPETRPREPVRFRSRSPFAGATAVNMSPAVADEMQLETSADGVAIAEIEDGSVAPARRVSERRRDPRHQRRARGLIQGS